MLVERNLLVFLVKYLCGVALDLCVCVFLLGCGRAAGMLRALAIPHLTWLLDIQLVLLVGARDLRPGCVTVNAAFIKSTDFIATRGMQHAALWFRCWATFRPIFVSTVNGQSGDIYPFLSPIPNAIAIAIAIPHSQSLTHSHFDCHCT